MFTKDTKLIRITTETAKALDKLKIIPRETYNEVIDRLIEEQ